MATPSARGPVGAVATAGAESAWSIDRHGSGPPAVVLHVPHAGTVMPIAVRSQLVLDDDGLSAELDVMTDWHTDGLAREASALSGVPLSVFANRLSRLVVDPERFAGGGEIMDAVGMGAVYRSTSALDVLRVPDPVRDENLLREYFHPYAAAFADLVDEVLAATGRCVIVDLHSFPSVALPYELDQDAPRPPVCIGTDEDHTPSWLGSVAAEAFGGLGRDVLLNTPFAGTYVPMRHYGLDLRVSSVMVEIRRDQYLCEPTEPLTERWVPTVAALARMLARIAAGDPDR